MLLGSGLKGQGGAVMLYSSKKLEGPWKYDGLVCFGEIDTGTHLYTHCEARNYAMQTLVYTVPQIVPNFQYLLAKCTLVYY